MERHSRGRIRQADASVRRNYKTKLRRKTSSNWDKPPAGYANITTAQYKSLQLSRQLPPNATLDILQDSVPVVGSSITRQARRLYIGNIPFGITETELMDYFNKQMLVMGLADLDEPVVACQINVDKGFAFLEFRSIDNAAIALQLDGLPFREQKLKIRRPHDYQELPGMQSASSSSVKPNAPVSNKIFIGNLPNYLKEEHVQEILKAFGELRSFNLVKDNTTGLNKGYGFCEYMDAEITDSAIFGLNNMNVGDKKILVQRASVGAKNDAFSQPVTIQVPGLSNLDIYVPPTEVLCLLNMVTPDDLRDDEEYEDILDDIREECNKFGAVRSLEIPRPMLGYDVRGCGKVFVEFQSVAACEKAQKALTGRKFNEKIVVTSYFDLAKYHQRKF